MNTYTRTELGGSLIIWTFPVLGFGRAFGETCKKPSSHRDAQARYLAEMVGPQRRCDDTEAKLGLLRSESEVLKQAHLEAVRNSKRRELTFGNSLNNLLPGLGWWF